MVTHSIKTHNDLIMTKLGNYVTGKWIEGDGEGTPLFNAVNGELIHHASTSGLDFDAILKIWKNYGWRSDT